MQCDFGGYATKNDLRCADGRIIRQNAFRANDGQRVPLVWSHQHKDPELVLGHAILENRSDGTYAYCYCNETPKGKLTKEIVKHGDVTAFSIFANHLKQDGSSVMHGNIVEVSLVLSGANPGAKIENAMLKHEDGYYEDLEEEATIFNGINIEHSDADVEHVLEHADEKEETLKDEQGKDSKEEEESKTEESNTNDDNETIGDVLDSMTEKQRAVTQYLVGLASEQETADEDDDDEVAHEGAEGAIVGEIQNGGNTVKHNVFDSEGYDGGSQIDVNGLFEATMKDAKNRGSFKDAFLHHAEEYGIQLGENTDTYDSTFAHADDDVDDVAKYGLTNPEIMFPNAQWLTNEPLIINYDQTWVNKIMTGIGKTPFSRVRTHDADIRIEEARARGYVKASEKAEIFYSVAKRETTPTTVYVKSKFDRDDVQDITNFSVVNYTRTNIMRPKLNEETARAILLGDGRSASSEDKISETNIRPIIHDDEHYTVRTVLTKGLDNVYDMIEEIGSSHDEFKGKGRISFFTTFKIHNKMKWAKDIDNRRVYKNGDSELIGDLNVNEIIDVDTFMDDLTVTYKGSKYKVMGVKVTLGDYNVGTDRGSDIFNAEDFDIDFNQYKFLMETRMSGALTRFHSAQVFLLPVSTTGGSSSGSGGTQTQSTQGSSKN